jgi:hypothetical protein
MLCKGASTLCVAAALISRQHLTSRFTSRLSAYLWRMWNLQVDS